MLRPLTPVSPRVLRALLMLIASALVSPIALAMPGRLVQDAGQGGDEVIEPVDTEFVQEDVPVGTEFAAQATNRIVATVSGEPITSSDVAYSLRVLTRGGPVDPQLEATIIRRMAEEILLAKEATRLGLDLSATQVDDRWQTWFGFKPNYEESALTAGTTVARQRALAKRTVLAELYVYNRVGLMTMPGSRIEVDLALKHLVDVTPQQLREYFLEFRQQLDQPATVSFTVYPAPDLQAADEVQTALLENRTPAGVSPIRQQVPLDAVPEVFAYEPELADFVAESLDGSICAPTLVQAQKGPIFLVIQVTGHTEALPAEFREVQEELRNRIQSNLLVQAKREVVLKLARQAVYYPANLFEEPLRGADEGG